MKLVHLCMIISIMAILTGGARGSAGFNAEVCLDRTTLARWCGSQLLKDGWTLKYRAINPPMMDAYWLYEIWMRAGEVVVCVNVGGRGGDRINSCQQLNEVKR